MLFISIIVSLISVIVNYIIIPLLTPQYIVHNEGIVLITGASTGIGNHAAIDIANKTNLTVLAGVRKEKDVETIKQLNIKNLRPIIIDVTSHESNVNALKEIQTIMKEENLKFIGLINNAGISRSIPVEFHTIDDVKYLFETNLFGVLDLCQLYLPLLRQSKGRIIQISSIAGLVTPTMSGIYSASKKALEALSDGLRREVREQEISVSVVNPGNYLSVIHLYPKLTA
jgi:short-subunit dehydrogenase